MRWRMETLQRHCECLSDTVGHQKAQERGRKSERPPCRDTHTQTSRDTMEMERQKGDFLMGEEVFEGREKGMQGQGQERQPSSSSQGPCSSQAGRGRGWGSPPGGRPVQGAAWGKLGGRIVISLGVLLNYTTSYLSPGGAAGGQTDGWTDTQGPGGKGGWGGPGRPKLRW